MSDVGYALADAEAAIGELVLRLPTNPLAPAGGQLSTPKSNFDSCLHTIDPLEMEPSGVGVDLVLLLSVVGDSESL